MTLTLRKNMDDIYRPPRATSDLLLGAEENVRGGFYTDGYADPIDCGGAWICLREGYFRASFVPRKTRAKVLRVFAICVFITMWFGIFGGFGHLLLYYIIKFVIFRVDLKKMEYDLSVEKFYYDTNSGILGMTQDTALGRVFLGCKPRKKSLDSIVSSLNPSALPLRKGKNSRYRALVFGISLIGLLVSVYMQTIFFG